MPAAVPTPAADTLSVAQLEHDLWSAADILRGSIDSGDYRSRSATIAWPSPISSGAAMND